MAKGKRGKKNESHSEKKKAVLNLSIDGSSPNAEVREETPAPADAFQTPCTVTGIMAGASGGTLGYVFGFAGYWMRQRLKGNLRGSLADGWASAKTFAIMGGLYAAVNCLMLRLRQKQDAWNGAASGCATGLALGWAGGPASAAQSCAMLGIFSFFIDGMAPAGDVAHAATLSGSSRSSSSSNRAGRSAGAKKSTLELLLSPAVPLLTALAPCRGGGCLGGGEVGCPVVQWPFPPRKA